MNKLPIALLTLSLLFGQSYYGSTTAPVIIAGGIIKATHSNDVQTKYKRKDCPVCKGKGWYMSGDNIKKIECTYCEPDKGLSSSGTIPAPTAPGSNCPDGKCPLNKKR